MPCEERLRKTGLLSLEKKWLWVQVPQRANPNAYGEMESGSSQWCMMQGQDITGITGNERFSLVKGFFQ